MSILDIECKESIFFSYKEKNCDYDCEYLLLGSDMSEYRIFLYFSLPPYSCIQKLREVKIILFKIPQKDNMLNIANIDICPLLSFFNYCYISIEMPDVDYKHAISYSECSFQSYNEIDITNIVYDWIGGKYENRGILLYAKGNSHLISYASNKHPINSMHPFVRITYDDCICNPCLSTVKCNVSII